jgi:hypothetical protein
MIPQAVAQDTLRAVIDSVFADPVYQWSERPAVLGWLADGWRWLTSALQQFQDANPALFRWFQVALVGVLALIMLHALWVMVRTTRAASDRERALGPSTAEAPRTTAWYQDHADALATQGRFTEALLAAFQALVLDLDRRGVLRYHPSKTPQEYTGEAALTAVDRERFGALVGMLYGYVFGHQPCGDPEYRHWLATASERWHATPA